MPPLMQDSGVALLDKYTDKDLGFVTTGTVAVKKPNLPDAQLKMMIESPEMGLVPWQQKFMLDMWYASPTPTFMPTRRVQFAKPLRARPRVSSKVFIDMMIETLDLYGWRRGTYGSTDRGFCLIGALRHVETKTGDITTASRVQHALHTGKNTNNAMRWNDRPWRTKGQVKRYLRATQRKMGTV